MLNTSVTYYQLLNVFPEATTEDIKAAYEKKILELSHSKVTNIEIYQTAYYTLSDITRRKAYDDSIGILHKNIMPFYKRIALLIGRFIFTSLDILAELVWSFLVVLILALICYGFYYYKNNDVFNLKNMMSSISGTYYFIAGACIILSIILYIMHPRIRSMNRKFKHSLRKYK